MWWGNKGRTWSSAQWLRLSGPPQLQRDLPFQWTATPQMYFQHQPLLKFTKPWPSSSLTRLWLSQISIQALCPRKCPTVTLSTIDILCTKLPTQMALQSENYPLVIYCRDVTKAFLQSTPLQRLIINKSPEQFYEYHPQSSGYGWCKTFSALWWGRRWSVLVPSLRSRATLKL